MPAHWTNTKVIGRLLGLVVIAGAIVTSLVAFYDTDRQPRTDDASVRATLSRSRRKWADAWSKLPVKDNAFVKKGDLLFEIDPRDYQYALKQALSDQNNLEQTDYRYAKKNCGREQRR